MASQFTFVKESNKLLIFLNANDVILMQYYAYMIRSLEAMFFSLIFKSIYLAIGTTKLLEIWQTYFYTPLLHACKIFKKSDNPCMRYTSLNLCHFFGTGCTTRTRDWGETSSDCVIDD